MPIPFTFNTFSPDSIPNLQHWFESDYGVDKLNAYVNGASILTDSFTGSTQRLNAYNSAWTESIGQWSITGGYAYCSSLASQAHAYRTGAARCVVTCSLTFTGGATAGGIIVNRLDDNNYWLIYPSFSTVRIYQQVAGGFTQLLNTAYSGGNKSTSATIAVTVIPDGDTITVIVDGETFTLGTIGRPLQQATGVGMRSHTDDGQTHFDNFNVYAISDTSYSPCASGDGIRRWRNRVGGQSAFAPYDLPPTYVTSGANSKHSIKTNSTGPLSMAIVDTIAKPCTIFIVGQMWGTSLRLLGALDSNWLHGWWNGFEDVFFYNQGFLTSTVSGSGTAKCYVGKLPTSGDASFWSGLTTITENSGTAYDAPLGGLLIGGYGRVSEASQGYVSALLVYSSALSDAERIKVTRYLKRKYGV